MSNIQSVIFGFFLYGFIPLLVPKLKYKMAIMDLILLILPISLPLLSIVGFYQNDLGMGYGMLGGTLGFFAAGFYIKRKSYESDD